MLTDLRVHIAPIGFDEPERVTKPLLDYKADKVFLISHLYDHPDAVQRLRSVRAALKKDLSSCNVQLKTTDIWDLFSCLQTYREIFLSETDNHVMVNVSTGSKIIAIAGMLSCMLWNGRPYYAKLNYSQQKEGKPTEVLGVQDLPVYTIQRPSPESLRVISVISKNKGVITKKKLIERLQSDEFGLIPDYGKDASPTAPHSKLRAILNPLEEWSLIRVKSRGRRSEIVLTIQGEQALKIFGDMEVENIPAVANEKFRY